MKILVLIVQIFLTFGIGILGQDVPTLNVNSLLQILQIVQKLDTKMEAFDTNLESIKEEVLQMKERMELNDENLKEEVLQMKERMELNGENLKALDYKMTSLDDNMSNDGRMTSVEDKIILMNDLLVNTQEQVSTIHHNLSEGQHCRSPNLDMLYETFEIIFEGERDIQREIVGNTCTKSQVENLQHLLETDECLDGIHNCSDTSTCKDTLIGFRCTCHSGYSGDGVNCQDIDECGLGKHNCSRLALCSNSDGGFECGCNPGYTGDGFHCNDLDECALGKHNCSSLALCSNSDGGFECSCFPGYSGDGFYCKDVDECADQDDACDVHSDCINTGGSFNCLCHSGYTGDGVSSCADIDECGLGSHNCSRLALCSNSDGGFECSCNPGYTGDGFHCKAISCEEPSQFMKELGCVIPVTERLSWDEAQLNCKDSFGGRLLMITTQEQLNKLKEQFEDFFKRANCYPWIGLRIKWSHEGGEGGYPIDPNSPLWHVGEPDKGSEECVYAGLSYSPPDLLDVACTHRWTSLCQIE